jgi:uncharacterized protein YaiI (UPF0178 family)
VRDERIAPGGALDPQREWLLLEYTTRFLVGVDTYRTQRWRGFGEVATRMRNWLGQLPDEVSGAISFANAQRVFDHHVIDWARAARPMARAQIPGPRRDTGLRPMRCLQVSGLRMRASDDPLNHCRDRRLHRRKQAKWPEQNRGVSSLATIWVDADACPRTVRDILYRAAERRRINVVLVANQPIDHPRSRFVQMLQVPRGFDIADNEIVSRVEPGDLVVTADIPLAADVIERKAEAVNPRGEPYSSDTIRQRLNMRDFMDTMRASGVQTGGPPALSAADRQAFANVLDRYLARLPRE